MKRNLITQLLIASTLIFNLENVFAQGFTGAEYKKALWMTTRMYGGQRSGENNWLIYNHLPAGVNASLRGISFNGDKDTDGYDLSGGWHDCGDHVKFGHTQFYSGYMLLKAFDEFPTGFDDKYSFDYKGYKNGGDWTYEGTNHDPNGIPDVLDEAKHATDFFIKCTRNATTFYYQVGEGDADHAQWVTSVKMQTLAVNQGGETRKVFKNPLDASMPSFCGAALALMSKVYRKYDPAYADLCLAHAKYAYAYAKANPGTMGVGFYPANGNWKDDYATMCAELFWATGTASYKTEAQSFTFSAASGQNKDIAFNYSFDYNNNGDIAIYNLAKLGTSGASTAFNTLVNDNYLTQTQADGQYKGGNTGWGVLRYNANSSFIVALWQKLNNQTTVNKFIYDNIDYLLGKNSSSLSFVIGFGTKYASHPHHRNVFLNDQNLTDAGQRTLTIPTKNLQFGYLVGGARTPGSYNDVITDYAQTEGGIDYNACLVGILGYITSKVSPVDTTKFGHKSPNLGESQSICGQTSIVLNANVTTDGKKTFAWQKDGVVVQAASTTKNTYTVTASGTYTCILDSAGIWSTKGSVVITGVLEKVDLGVDKVLCDPSMLTLDMGVTGAVTYAWSKDGKVISGASSKTLNVYTGGIYTGKIAASGCLSVSDEITVTSNLPVVTNDTICKAGNANLAVSGSGGPYEWYSTLTSSTVLATGASYQPTISTNSIYYIKDASSIAALAGPSSTANTLSSSSNGGFIGMKFTASKAFTITQMKVQPYVYGCNSGDMVSVTFALEQNGTVLATYTSTGVACVGSSNATTFYTINFATPINVPSAGSYTLRPTTGNTLGWYSSGANFISMDAAGVMDITDDTRDDNTVSFPAIFDIKIQAGSTCARSMAFANIDANLAKCKLTDAIEDLGSINNSIIVYPNPSSSSFTIKGIEDAELKLFDNVGKEILHTSSLTFGSNLLSGVYHLLIFKNGTIVKSINLIKQ